MSKEVQFTAGRAVETPDWLPQLAKGEMEPISSFGIWCGYRFRPSRKMYRKWRDNRGGCKRYGLNLIEGDGGDGDWATWQVFRIYDEHNVERSSAMEPEEHGHPVPANCLIRPRDGTVPRGYQLAGAQSICRDNTLLADEQGLGKTLTALMGMASYEAYMSGQGDGYFCVLLICPPSLRLWWEREAKRILPETWEVCVSKGKSPMSEPVFVDHPVLWICGSSTITDQFKLREHDWDMLVIDEAHQFKNIKAKRTKAVIGTICDRNTFQTGYQMDERLSGGIRAGRKLFMTGTPIPKSPIELYPLVAGLWGQHVFGTYTEFGEDFCGAFESWIPWLKRKGYNYTPRWDKMSRQKKMQLRESLRELRILLLNQGLVRRTKEQAVAELPPKTYQVIPIEPTTAVLQSLRAEEEEWSGQEHIARWAEKARAAVDEAEREEAVEQLAQACTRHMVKMHEFTKRVGEGKAGMLLSTFEDMLDEDDESLVIFAHHRSVVELLADGLKKYGSVKFYGGMSDEEKDEAVRAFQNREARVFVGNIVAAGVGLTLTASSRAVFVESDWNPSNMAQAADRIHRIGQTKPCLIQHYVLDGSIDQLIAESQMMRQAISEVVIDGGVGKVLGPQDRGWKAENVRAQSEYLKGDLLERKRGPLKEALIQINDRCDGGLSHDGEGWSSADMSFGSSLAEQNHPLTDDQCEAAVDLVRKYRGQVEADLVEAIFGMVEPDGDEWEYDESQLALDDRSYYTGEICKLQFKFLEGEVDQHYHDKRMSWLEKKLDELD